MKKRKDSEKRFPNGLSVLIYELKGSKIFFLAGMVLSAAVAVIDLINPRVISCVIDYILGSEPMPESGIEADLIQVLGGAEQIRRYLWIPALFVVAAAAVGALFRYSQNFLNNVGAERLVKRMRNTLFCRADRLPVPWYGQNSTGDILQRCTSDVETVKQFVSVQLTSFVRIILLIGLSIAFMSGINVPLTLTAAGFIPVIVGYSLYYHSRIGRVFMQADTEEGKVSGIVQENLTGIRVVRAFGKEAYECERFIGKNKVYTEMWVKLMRLMSVFWSLGDLISGIQVMTVVVLGAVFCVNGELSAGNYVAFISYNAMLTWPVRELGRTIADLSRAGVSIERIRYILNAEPEQLDDKKADLGEEEKPLISFENVSFSYVKGRRALQNINIRINKGEKIGIIGGTGSGKSTLADLLMRMCDESGIEGTVLYRGKDIKTYPLSDYRRQFSRVLQEPFLFSGTIAENIGIGSELSSEEIKQCAGDAGLMPAVEKFTDGFDTFVGERGVTLSGGQKQRCAIASVLAKDSEVMILDDAFSALDAQTENEVRKNLFERFSDKTVMIISHRISTIAACDRIYVLDKGRIAAEGTHGELISREGIYREIYELQTEQ